MINVSQNKKPVYCILAAPGAGSFFLASVFAKYLNYPCNTTVSHSGHCHNLGQGDWVYTKFIVNALHLVPDCEFINQDAVFVGHTLPNDYIKKKPHNLKIVLIDYELSDSYYIALLHSVKAFSKVWTEDHYNTIAGPDWSSYNWNVMLTSKLVRDELLPYRIEEMNQWINSIDLSIVDYFINFKTVFGLNSIDLNQQVTNILNTSPDPAIELFINEYQKINQKLYNFY
jgi:hypothetical protein